MQRRSSTAVALVAIAFVVAGCGGGETPRDEAGEAARESTASGTARSGSVPSAYTPGSRAVDEADRSFQIADTLQTLTGIMVMGEEVEVFRMCGGVEETWVRDLSGGSINRAIRDLQLEPYQAFYVHVRGIIMPPFRAGPGVEYGSRFEVHELLEASVDTSRCEGVAGEAGPDASAQEALPMGDAELLASGNEPFWNVSVSDDGIVFARMGEDDMTFPYAEATVSAGTLVYSSRIENAERHEIEIVVEEQPCSDTMSGARFTHVAEVTFDGRRYRGCARRS